MTHSKLWTDMFVLGLPVGEKILRSVLVYAFLIVGLRVAGKRELAQLNTFDLVVLLTLSNTVQNAIIGDDNTLVGGVIGAATLLALNYVTVRFLVGHPRVEQAVEGDPTTLVHQGRILRNALKRELIPESELEAAARRQGFDGLKEVEEAVLEPGGLLTFVGRKPGSDDLRHRELLDRIDGLSREIKAWKAGYDAPPA